MDQPTTSIKMDDNKTKALSAALSQIERQFGKGAVMRLGDGAVQNIEAIPTGSLALDNALGIGGFGFDMNDVCSSATFAM